MIVTRKKVEGTKKSKGQKDTIKEIADNMAKMILSFSKVTDVLKTSSTLNPSMAQCVGEGVLYKLLQQGYVGDLLSCEEKYTELIKGIEAGLKKYKSTSKLEFPADPDLEFIMNMDRKGS